MDKNKIERETPRTVEDIFAETRAILDQPITQRLTTREVRVICSVLGVSRGRAGAMLGNVHQEFRRSEQSVSLYATGRLNPAPLDTSVAFRLLLAGAVLAPEEVGYEGPKLAFDIPKEYADNLEHHINREDRVVPV